MVWASAVRKKEGELKGGCLSPPNYIPPHTPLSLRHSARALGGGAWQLEMFPNGGSATAPSRCTLISTSTVQCIIAKSRAKGRRGAGKGSKDANNVVRFNQSGLHKRARTRSTFSDLSVPCM